MPAATSPSPAGGEEEELSVHENFWVREETPEGRTYFFNRATGATQWHVPNDLYRARVPKIQTNRYKEDLIRFPADAKAGMRVDCVTEAPSKHCGPSEDEILEQLRLDQEEADRIALEEQEQWARDNPIVIRHPILTMHIISAKGLRDTDFMPGKDKSDPYCMMQVIGAKGEKNIGLRTQVVQDELDPNWDFKQLVVGYKDGDSLEFSVWDADEIRPLASGSDVFESNVDDGDDLLGRITLTPKMVMGMKKPATFELEEAGEEQAWITLWCQIDYEEEYIDPRAHLDSWKRGVSGGKV